ncbi:coatomer WD associated region-domain-containing protein [Thamnocephalis sphaerospora]|uniref:Coatomer subunit beta' n=1 Tax=Thamnocephalis sphaerospora TaxID=78915 RepID=A0A4P9XPH8_9FUNG|nr:coatomer WD associated region-domain-containing protein [Thamnocephalis sphaerospora]|eukprot:RKP07896.1 coatomer WD associated region-domain-containing protein [Thamnocephalis sphaerospora]
MKLDVKRKLLQRSERVKCVEFHPTEPLLLAALYSGKVNIWNYESQTLVKTIEVCALPVRTARFVPRKNWIVTGSDDMQLRCFNYNTLEKVATVDAHADYIRSIAVHPTQPYIFTGSDDMRIKMWDWEKGWKCVKTFEGHSHYVMKIAINPKDVNTFASASQDRTVKVWSLGSDTPNYTLEGHEKGLNYVDYYHGSEKPYLITAADDKTVKIWDYQNKTCVHTLEGHTQNVAAASFHPYLPIILTASEDGTVRVWHANNYRLENTLNYGLDRAWSMSLTKASNEVAVGFDEGLVVFKLGRDEPSISMDTSGKIIWAKQTDVQTANVKATIDANVKDGERMQLPVKDMGTAEVYPQSLQHSPNGRFVVVCGDGEYIIYTALAWRNKTFGAGLEFVWAQDSNMYAVRESATKIKVYKNFKEITGLFSRIGYAAEGIFGGNLLAVRSSSYINFHDWETGNVVRRIDVAPKRVIWSDSGDLVALACDDSCFILRFDRSAYDSAAEAGEEIPEEGVDDVFEIVHELADSVRSGCWVGDCFIYTNAVNRLSYLVGTESFTIAHFDTNMYLLGYIPRDNRVYIADKDVNVCSYVISLSVIEYQTAILRGDLETAESLLPSVPEDQRSRIARFLESQDLKELALSVSTDDEHRFELALQLDELDIALEIARSVETDAKWRTLGDAALNAWKFSLAEECLLKAKDLSGLLLLYTASGNAAGIEELAKQAAEQGKNNIAFACWLQLGNAQECLDLLVKTERIPEAAIFARTYLPSRVADITKLWREHLETNGKQKLAAAIADPTEEDGAFFPGHQDALAAEELSKKLFGDLFDSTAFPEHEADLERDLIAGTLRSWIVAGLRQC